MSGYHKRSPLNAALDKCPEIVQQAVWGEGGYREQIEILTEALRYAENKLYILKNTKNAVRLICRRDVDKAHERVCKALEYEGTVV